MKFISLVDTKNQNILTIDATSLILRLEMNGISKETRIKPYMASLLYTLFCENPNPLSYDRIIVILKEHHLLVTDLTRMHRKLSEIRQYIRKIHPSLGNFIFNIRGVGYSLPLQLKKLHTIGSTENSIKFTNEKMIKALQILEMLINDSIDMTAQSKVIKDRQGYLTDRDAVKHILIEKISLFNECTKTILREIRCHEADFMRLRIEYFLATLKTYISLVRISEYPISQSQWLDWFKQEILTLFDELRKLIRATENL